MSVLAVCFGVFGIVLLITGELAGGIGLVTLSGLFIIGLIFFNKWERDITNML